MFIFTRNLKDIIVISNCAKFHFSFKGSNVCVKFVFYTTAIKITELGRMSREEVMRCHSLNNNNKRVIVLVIVVVESKGAFTPADLDWIWTQFGQYLSPPNRDGLGKNSDRTQANVNAIGLTSDWKWTGCHGEVVVHSTSGQQCAPVK